MKGTLSWLKRGLAGLLALAVVTVSAGLVYRSVCQWQIKSTTRIESPDGIESLEAVQLGGIEQWIYLRGHDRDKPVLLYLHGGPGAVEMPLAREFGLELEEHFVVVHWDQRASGKSIRDDILPDSLTVKQYVSDTLELIDHLRNRFDAERVYLLGHSWGTLLGTLVARDHPDLLHAYIGMGQLVNMRRNEEISYRFVADRARASGNEEALAELSELTPPYEQDLSGLIIQRKWLDHFGGSIYQGSMIPVLLRGLLSPEYSLTEVVAIIETLGDIMQPLYGQMLAVDFIEQAPHLDVPVYFLTGRHDYNTPFELVERYYEILKAPHKEIIWFEHSAHSPNLEEPERFQDVLINKILLETFPGVY